MFKQGFSIIVILFLSLIILFYKGYFNIRTVYAPDLEVQGFLNSNFSNKLSVFRVSNSTMGEVLKSEYSWIKDVSLKLRPDLSVEVIYSTREVFAVADKQNYFISKNGVLFSKSGVTLDLNNNYPTFVYGGQELGARVFRPEEISFIQDLTIFPELTISNTNSKSYVKPLRYNWFVEIVALNDSKKTANSTNVLLKELESSKDLFSSILVIGDRLVVKE